MLALTEARILDDDWTGTVDPVERRRRQNRLHQRAWRRRKRLQQSPETDSPTVSPSMSSLVDRDTFQKLALDHVSGRQRMKITLKQLQNWESFGALLETLGNSAATFAVWAELRSWRRWELICDLPSSELWRALPQYSPSPSDDSSDQSETTTPTTTFDSLLFLNKKYSLHGSEYQVNFPFSLDHELFILIQHNALRGMLTNMAILIRLSGRDFQGWDDFYTDDLPIPPENSPPSLHFTNMQRTVPHESWIDVIPWARMRDNVIKYQDKFDTDELCYDFLGGFEEGVNDTESRGIILWGDPWCETAWELSEGFARKWWFLMQGCSDIIASSNKWRVARGEKKLVIKL